MSNSIGNLKNSGLQGNNFPWQLKMLQGLQAIADATSAPLTCVEDSIAICAGGNLLTSTTIGADTGLDVNIIGGVTLSVNLDANNDNVGIYGYVNGAAGSPVPLNVNATGQVAIQDGGNSITVDGTVSLSAGTLSALESITVQNPGGASAVNIQDGGNSITVDATALDIRPLTCADKVSLCFNDGVSDLTVSTTNPLPVNATVTFPSSLQSNTYDGAGVNPITSTSTGLITALDVNVIPSVTNVLLDSLVETTDGDLSLFGNNITSITFQSIGTAVAKVSVNGGSSFFDLAPGTVINLAPNVTGGYYQGTLFFWDLTTNPGSSLLIIYNYI